MLNSSSLHRWRDILITAIAPVIWGSTYIVTSEFLPPDRPFTAALIRVLPAGILLILFTRQFPSSKDFWKLIVLSALNIGLFQALLFVAAYRLPGGLAAVLGAIQPLIVMVLVWLASGKPPARMTLGSAIFGVIGMAILLLSPQTVFEPIGMAAALIGAVCMATGVWLTQRWKIGLSLLSLTGWQLTLGGLMLAPLAWFMDAPLPVLGVTEWSAYGYLSLAGALLAYALWFRGIARLPTIAVASLGLLSPLTAVVLGWIFLSQSITGTALVGLTIVLLSIFAVQWTTIRNQ